MPTDLPLSFSGTEIRAVSVSRAAPEGFVLRLSVQPVEDSAFTVVLSGIWPLPDLDMLLGASRVIVAAETDSFREFGRVHLEAFAEAHHELWAEDVSVVPS